MTPDDLKARITARRAEAVERRAIAEGASRGPWHDAGSINRVLQGGRAGKTVAVIGLHYKDATHIAANDPATVIRDQDRIIAGCDADLALLDRLPRGLVTGGTYSSSVAMLEAITANLNARYSDADS